MKIILKENIENLGSKGDIVNVAAGYGRNYLLPKKLAIAVTKTNMKMIEMEQASLKKNLEKARMSYQDVIQKLNDVSLSFERKAGEKDTIFGSVSVSDIKEALDKLSFEIEKKKILLKEPIKRLGKYTVSIKVFLDDIAEIKIQVVPEGGEEVSVKPVVDKGETEPKTKKTRVETAKEEPVGETQEEKKLEDTVNQEDKEVVEEKTETEANTEVELKDMETEKKVVEANIDEEVPKAIEKDEGKEKSKTSK